MLNIDNKLSLLSYNLGHRDIHLIIMHSIRMWFLADYLFFYFQESPSRKRFVWLKVCHAILIMAILKMLSKIVNFVRLLHLRGLNRGVARGVLGCPWPPLGRPSFEQTKTPWQYLGRKSHCWEAHFLKIFFFVKYFRQRLLSLVNMGLHAAIIRHDNLVSSLCDPPFEKSWLRPC